MIEIEELNLEISLPKDIIPYKPEEVRELLDPYGEINSYLLLGGYYSTWVDIEQTSKIDFESCFTSGSLYLLDVSEHRACLVLKDNGVVSQITITDGGTSIKSTDKEELHKIVEILKQKTTTKLVPNSIGIVTTSGSSLDYTDTEIKRVEFNPDYYSDEVNTLRKEILPKLVTPDSSLYLFHGKPGTGKTFFLRSLISDIKTLNSKKKVFYIPPFIVESMSSPEFITFALNNMQESILIVEDAEEALKGQGNRNMAVNNLLNVSDGILGDALKCHILCTFNQDVKNLDSAIVRKGRLKYIQEFTELPADKIEKICGIKEPMTLGDALNREDTGIKQQLKIGFQ